MYLVVEGESNNLRQPAWIVLVVASPLAFDNVNIAH